MGEQVRGSAGRSAPIAKFAVSVKAGYEQGGTYGNPEHRAGLRGWKGGIVREALGSDPPFHLPPGGGCPCVRPAV